MLVRKHQVVQWRAEAIRRVEARTESCAKGQTKAGNNSAPIAKQLYTRETCTCYHRITWIRSQVQNVSIPLTRAIQQVKVLCLQLGIRPSPSCDRRPILTFTMWTSISETCTAGDPKVLPSGCIHGSRANSINSSGLHPSDMQYLPISHCSSLCQTCF